MTVKTASPAKAVPVATPTTRPYWDGARAGELRLQRCADCHHHFLYPRTHCPSCGSANTPWVKASGRAKLYSYVINHFPAPGWEGETPYVIASYVVTLGAIGLYTWRMLARARKIAPQVREEDRPWT